MPLLDGSMPFADGKVLTCDVAHLCAWCWAIVFWKEGLERESHLRLLLASGLVAVAALTKYFGIALLPIVLKDPSRTVWFEGHWGWLGKVPPERYRIFEVIGRLVPPEHAVK